MFSFLLTCRVIKHQSAEEAREGTVNMQLILTPASWWLAALSNKNKCTARSESPDIDQQPLGVFRSFLNVCFCSRR